MLRVQIYANSEELDDIQIVNIKKRNKNGETKYRVGSEHATFTVYHDRDLGWKPLLIKVLKQMKKLER